MVSVHKDWRTFSSEVDGTEIEERLVLLAWLNDLFGYGHNRDLLADLKETAERFDATGRSFLYYRIIGRGDKVKILSLRNGYHGVHFGGMSASGETVSKPPTEAGTDQGLANSGAGPLRRRAVWSMSLAVLFHVRGVH